VLRPLSLVESRVASLVAAGLSDVEIAARLGIGLGEVGGALASAVRRLGLRSRTELALLLAGGAGEDA
jgi:DNA-binding CsgD family transcriptional regulator